MRENGGAVLLLHVTWLLGQSPFFTEFVLNMTGFVLDMTGCVLDMAGFITNNTVFCLHYMQPVVLLGQVSSAVYYRVNFQGICCCHSLGWHQSSRL